MLYMNIALAAFTDFKISSMFLPLALAIIIVLLMRRLRRKQRQSARSDRATLDHRGRAASQSAEKLPIPPAMQRWEVTMHEISRDTSAQLDSKMGALAHLIRTAEAEAERLERAIATAREQRQPAADDPPKPPSESST